MHVSWLSLLHVASLGAAKAIIKRDGFSSGSPIDGKGDGGPILGEYIPHSRDTFNPPISIQKSCC